ncbi:MAG: aldo/keto reductase, partial [Synergistaceae bacterium]|nr:aldo/keto reductase [Synergistaceae bacterium]
ENLKMGSLKMETRRFEGIGREVSLLGFGLMRLPLRSDRSEDIDFERAEAMVDRALEAGVNYFDTAWIYHEGQSEVFAGAALNRHPREKFNLATKLWVRNLESAEEAEREFARQLEKCRVDYFDFYLLHNLNEESWSVALEHRLCELLLREKERGRIRRLGFSLHGSHEHLERVAKEYDWDFAQIQINYVDWDAMNAKRHYQVLEERGIPAVVMEPVRGGALAHLPPRAEEILKAADPEASPSSWALRYAASLPGVMTVLSGMSSLEQVEDNIKTMTGFRPLSEKEREVLERAAAAYRASGFLPCTGCRYCMPCPSGVDIPGVFAAYNRYRASLAENPSMAPILFQMTNSALTPSERAHRCSACGQCRPRCPQGIDVPRGVRETADFAAGIP